MNYKQKRTIRGFSRVFVAHKLGIDLEKYKEIESGERHLEKRYVDLFQEVTGVQSYKKYKLEQTEDILNAKALLESGELKKRFREFGYTTKEFADTINYSANAVTLAFANNFKQGRRVQANTYDLLLVIYYFLNEPMNKKIDKKSKVKTEKPIIEETVDNNVEEPIEISTTIEAPKVEPIFTQDNEQTFQVYRELITQLQNEVDFYKKIINKLIS